MILSLLISCLSSLFSSRRCQILNLCCSWRNSMLRRRTRRFLISALDNPALDISIFYHCFTMISFRLSTFECEGLLKLSLTFAFEYAILCKVSMGTVLYICFFLAPIFLVFLQDNSLYPRSESCSEFSLKIYYGMNFGEARSAPSKGHRQNLLPGSRLLSCRKDFLQGRN